jgi:hypothetical protein
MVTKNELIGLLLLVFFCNIALFLRFDLFGFDGFASAACILHGFCYTLAWQRGALMIFGFLPANLFLFKTIMFASMYLSIIPVFLILKDKWGSEKAFLSVFVVMGLSPVFLFNFGEFENELFAWPLIFWGLYFFWLKKWGVGVLCWAYSLLFWLWVGYLKNFPWITYRPTLEQLPFSGMLDLWLLFPLVFFVPLVESRKLRWLFLFFVGLYLWNAKYFMFLFVALAFVVPIAFETLDDIANKYKYFVFDKNFLLMLAFFCCVGVNCAYLIQAPTPTELNMVEEAVVSHESANFKIYNDWDYGYWLWYKGFPTKMNPGRGGLVDFNNLDFHSLVLTKRKDDLQERGCVPVNHYTSYARRMTLWKCD